VHLGIARVQSQRDSLDGYVRLGALYNHDDRYVLLFLLPLFQLMTFSRRPLQHDALEILQEALSAASCSLHHERQAAQTPLGS
jgi:hypothetical protein